MKVNRMKFFRRAFYNLLFVVFVICVQTNFVFAGVSAPQFVKDEAVFWLDASSLTQLPGEDVTIWPDVRGGAYPTATSCSDVIPKLIATSDERGTMSGKKAVTFFTTGTQCDMNFPTDYNVKSVFFVVDIDPKHEAFLLGGPQNATKGGHTYGFHRNGANYKYVYTPSCTYWNDGIKVENPQDTAIPTGYQLISYRYDENGAGVAVQQLTRDRDQSSRVGGRRL